MIKKEITVNNAINCLNEIFKHDPEAVALLVKNRIPCNKALAAHESVQVRENCDGKFSVGILGILNGLFGADEKGYGPIAAVCEKDGTITSFQRYGDRNGN